MFPRLTLWTVSSMVQFSVQHATAPVPGALYCTALPRVLTALHCLDCPLPLRRVCTAHNAHTAQHTLCMHTCTVHSLCTSAQHTCVAHTLCSLHSTLPTALMP